VLYSAYDNYTFSNTYVLQGKKFSISGVVESGSGEVLLYPTILYSFETNLFNYSYKLTQADISNLVIFVSGVSSSENYLLYVKVPEDCESYVHFEFASVSFIYLLLLFIIVVIVIV
jgi:hypothetical protein